MAKTSKGKPDLRANPVARPKPATFIGSLTPSAETQKPNRWQTFAVCLLLGLGVWAVFGQTLNHDFVNFDDNKYVYENAFVSHGLSLGSVAWAFTHFHYFNWHPLTTLSHMLDCQLYGLNPGGHHLTNVMLHAATAMLLFGALRKLTGAFWRSAMVAAIFAIHPLRVESVAWVADRKDLLSGLFFVLTLWAYARYVQKQGTGGGRFGFFRASSYWLALGVFALGLMSKPMLVTVPLVLLLLDRWPLARFTMVDARFKLGRLLWEKVLFLAFSAAVCVVTVPAQSEAIELVPDFGLPARIGTAVISYLVYMWQMVYPAGLVVPYLHPGNHAPLWQAGVSALLVTVISTAVFLGRKSRPYALVGWLWYLGMLVPVIGLVQVGVQVRADRYTYLPQIGLYILVVWGAVELCGKWRQGRVVLWCGAVAILSGLLAAAYIQTGYWKNSITLWNHTLACTSGNWIAHYNLGNALDTQGKLVEAIGHYRKSLEIKPDFAEAHYNWSRDLIKQGNFAEAIQHCDRALQLNPEKPIAALAHNNLGYVLSRQGKLDEAIGHYERSLELDPDSALAHINLGNALSRQGKWNEAIQHYERTLQLSPVDADAHNNIGMALVNQRKFAEALPHFQQALNLATAQTNPALAETIRTRLKALPAPAPKTPLP